MGLRPQDRVPRPGRVRARRGRRRLLRGARQHDGGRLVPAALLAPARTAASRRRSCRSTSPSSSSCTTPGAGARPSSANSSPPWWREVPTTPDPDKSDRCDETRRALSPRASHARKDPRHGRRGTSPGLPPCGPHPPLRLQTRVDLVPFRRRSGAKARPGDPVGSGRPAPRPRRSRAGPPRPRVQLGGRARCGLDPPLPSQRRLSAGRHGFADCAPARPSGSNQAAPAARRRRPSVVVSLEPAARSTPETGRAAPSGPAVPARRGRRRSRFVTPRAREDGELCDLHAACGCARSGPVPSHVVWKWPERVASGAMRLAAVRRRGQAGGRRPASARASASRPPCAW